jgi:hypothetical protein
VRQAGAKQTARPGPTGNYSAKIIIKKDNSVTLLPQLNKDFVQNQFNTEILTQTPNIVKPSDPL